MQIYPPPQQQTYNAEVELIHGITLLAIFPLWTKTITNPVILTNNVEINFALTWLNANPHLEDIAVITDARARDDWARISHQDERIHARNFPTNTPQRANLLVDRRSTQTWHTTATFTFADHTNPMNYAAIVRSAACQKTALAYCSELWNQANPINPSSKPPSTLAKLK